MWKDKLSGKLEIRIKLLSSGKIEYCEQLDSLQINRKDSTGRFYCGQYSFEKKNRYKDISTQPKEDNHYEHVENFEICGCSFSSEI